MANIIRFIPENKIDFETDAAPSPAQKEVPQWYKDIPQERENNHTTSGFRALGRARSTVKKCTPYLDALTTGYMFCLPFEIGVDLTDGVQSSYWKVNRKQNALVPDVPFRTEGIPVPYGYGETAWRLEIFPRVITPSGYSVLVTHPFNRYDLPFLTLSGVVETDSFHNPLAATVHLRSDFQGVLPKGTPIAQIFPFKREDWKSKWEPPFSEVEQEKENFKIFSIINRSYHTQFWRKKSYE
jgi:hypothetical protein